MKASIKFREDQPPLTRAKIPLTILNMPLQSEVILGSSKELSLSLSTSFSSGPSMKVAYKPNDSSNALVLVLKSGMGRFGAPGPSPVSMSGEFGLGVSGPTFFIKFCPKFGDFCLKKSQSSDFVNKRMCGDDSNSVSKPETVNSGFSSAAAVEMLSGMLRGTEASARTSLPVMRRAVVSFRWGFRVPADGTVNNLPVLVMNKIGIEHVTDDMKGTNEVEISTRKNDDIDTWLGMKRQLEMIQCENGMMKKAMDDLRFEFAQVGRGSTEKKLNDERDVKEDAKKAM